MNDVPERSSGGGGSGSAGPNALHPTLEASDSIITSTPYVPIPPSSTRTNSAPWCPPTEFDDYVLVRLVGRGAMGAVYLAEDRLLARQVAIKFVSALDPGEVARKRFENEARAVARVEHPNVIRIYRAGVLDDRPYLVTEYVRGEPLDQLPVPMPWAKVLSIGIDLARGLSAAHRRGVLHCDIKPQNAILTEDGNAKLVDFGLARMTHGRAGEGRAEGRGEGKGEGAEGSGVESQGPGVAEGLIRGTPHFMAPELWWREPPSKRSDVYGLGALLFQLAAGACPFEGMAAHELWRHVQSFDAPPLRSVAPGVDVRFAAIVDRCLRRASSERFASGDDLREALEQLKRRAADAPPPSGNPYRGLRAFEAGQRALFRGRDVEVGILLDRLRTETFVVVAGDSGVGKSSLCRAGVLPAVREGALGGGQAWSVLDVTPGERPLSALAATVAAFTGLDGPRLERTARQDRGAFADALAGRIGAGLLLFIDQAEEFLTISDPAERDAADAAIAALDALPGVRVLVTLRTDFLARFASLPNLGEDVARALYILRPLSPARVREVIVGPAEATGLRFESEEMVDELAAAAQAGGGLPILQFALAELWKARDARAGVIPRAALDALGGVGGALAKHADSLVLTLPSAQRVEARRMLVRLVTLEDTRVRRSEAELAPGPAARAALSAMVRGRLLVAHEDETGSAYEVAHEVLIREWATLRRWLAEDVATRSVRERLETAAAEWGRAGRPRDVLWSARQLQEASALAPDDRGGIGGEFLQASEFAAKRERRTRLAVLVGTPLIVALAYGGAIAKARYETGRLRDRAPRRGAARRGRQRSRQGSGRPGRGGGAALRSLPALRRARKGGRRRCLGRGPRASGRRRARLRARQHLARGGFCARLWPRRGAGAARAGALRSGPRGRRIGRSGPRSRASAALLAL
ncbi:MAG: serine/threonine-protein kinase [Polyangiaceae bacterium]|nr:serine/threonine-protein kinase [Polyangiaceae bacterium]